MSEWTEQETPQETPQGGQEARSGGGTGNRASDDPQPRKTPHGASEVDITKGRPTDA